MLFGVGETYYGSFRTFNNSGALTNADSTPTCTLVVNGTDTAVTVTITNPVTGRYAVSCSLAGRSVGDVCWVRYAAAVNTVSQENVLPTFRIAFPAALSTGIITAGTNAAQLSTSGGKVAATIASGDNSDKTGYTLTAAYDAAKSAAQAGDAMALVTGAITSSKIGNGAFVAAQFAAGALNGKGDWFTSASYTAPDNTSIAAIKAKTDTIPTQPAAVGSVMTLADGAITALKIAANALNGKGDWLLANSYAVPPTANDIATQVDTTLTTAHGTGAWAAAGSTDTGARSVTITVTNGSVGVEGAHVRVTKGATTYPPKTTNSGGQVHYNLDDGTWLVSITAPGYDAFPGASLVVDGAETATYALTSLALPVSDDPDLIPCYGYARNSKKIPEVGVIVTFRCISPPGQYDAWRLEEYPVSSDTSGLFSIDLPAGSVWEYWRGQKGTHATFTVPLSGSKHLPLTTE